MEEFIPPHKREAVSRAFQATFGRECADSLTPMKFGFSSAVVLKAVVAQHSVVLRVELQSDPTTDPARHFECLRLAADAGISPALLYAEPDDGVTVTEFIQGVPFSQFSGGRDAMLRALADTVRQLQTAQGFPHFKSYFDAIAMIGDQVRGSNLFASGVLDPAFAAFQVIAEAYPKADEDQAPCHNDLNPTNLLYDGSRIWVVDWESGFQGDRYVDLATLANSFAWTEEDEAVMLDAFFAGKVTEENKARFTLMRLVCRFFGAMVILRVASAERAVDAQRESSLTANPTRSFYYDPLFGTFGRVMATAEGRLSYGKALLNDFLAGFHSSTCLDAIALVQSVS